MAEEEKAEGVSLRQSNFNPQSLGAFRSIPNEIVILVFAFLPTEDLLTVSRACKHWNYLSEDDSLWRPLYNAKWNVIKTSAKVGSSNDDNLIGWRSWKNKYTTKGNWLSGHVVSKYVLHPHGDEIISCLQFDEDKYVTGSSDKTLKIISMSNGSVRQTLKGHTKSVTCVQFDNKIIASGSKDNTIKIWKPDGSECIKTLKGHTGWITGIQITDTKLMSRSYDLKANIWDLTTGQLLKSHRGNSVCNCFMFQGALLVCGYASGLVRAWDMRTGTAVKSFDMNGACLCLDLLDGATIACGGCKDPIKLWDMRTTSGGRANITSNHGWVTSLQFSSNKLISGGKDGLVNVWDLHTKLPLFRLEGHKLPITKLQVDEKKVVSVGRDGAMCIWNLSESMPYGL
eukprot:TRINITY_DN9551_c0_g1_i1.p1 TRINITY_DN9551_c0_g1~~TRINITY_DN9551_c0_g1_i1.p1  ORF type:complete len:398 (-),score=55.57 TRINITY_DN9551_c0_g1_i1:36-1229(-)